MIWFFLACASEFAHNPFEYQEDQDTHVATIEDLLAPTLIGQNDSNNIIVLDRDAEEILELTTDGEIDSWMVDPIPLQFTDRFMLTENGISTIESPDDLWISESNIDSIFLIGNDLHWTKVNDDGTEIHSNSGMVQIEEIMDEIEVVDLNVYFISRDEKTLGFINTEQSIENWGVETAFTFSDEPRKITSYNGELFITTRSTRWPYGGWVLRLTGTTVDLTASRLSNSPPEAEHVVVTDNTVYWSSKQSITSVDIEGGTYTMIAPSTTVGDLHTDHSTLWWTDTKGGRVFHIPIEP